MISRRVMILSVLASGAPWPRLSEARSIPETAQALVELAAERAHRPYSAPMRAMIPPFDRLDYDSYRGVRPLPGKAGDISIGDKFRADLLPPGWLFYKGVDIALPGHDTAFAPDMFSYDPQLVSPPAAEAVAAQMGFSGLRLRTPLNMPEVWDEVLVMQGASYFRALARDTVYGLSARALALGTGGPEPEEFPHTEAIRVFSADDRVHFGCLIDSPRASAALIVTLMPGEVTRMDCALHLFPRVSLADVGIAPLTSMFQHNALGPARIDDFRPAVHDSDLLVIENGMGEQLWRPLANPARLEVSAFRDAGPRGFGLVQSPTRFAAFKDAEAAYHRRPSAWVRPLEDWGAGAVMLVEIPTENEFADNIVAFWRPDAPLEPGGHVFRYRLDWLPPGPEPLTVADLPFRLARMASGVEPNHRTGRLFVLDFASRSGALPDPLPQAVFGPVEGAVIEGVALYPLAETGSMRLSFILTPQEGTSAVELRLSLQGSGGEGMSPVFLHRWTRTEAGGV